MTIQTAKRIAAHQLEWATRTGIAPAGNYTERVEDNVFDGQLHPATRAEYEKGKGHELEGEKANMKALHSSSALVVNVFDYWRRQNRIQDIAGCCGAEGVVDRMEFEETHPIKGMGRTPPHLDVEFAARVPLAIESKFTETYHRKTRRPLRSTHLDKYLEHPDLWFNLPDLKALAERIVGESAGRTEFEYLDVPQLIKHMLGLNCAYQGQFSLVYLWYRMDSVEAEQHQQELNRFCDRLGNEVKFRSMTYQDLFNRIMRVPDVDLSYLQYLEQRYFSLS